ncbi:MAG: ABC transporter permease, partial [Rhodobacteraceae bacterium]|nr:ABC transporter permease [Paracoccaceae bacterium]
MAPTLAITRADGGTRIEARGRVVLATLAALSDELGHLEAAGPTVVELGRVEAMDTAGAWLVVTTIKRLEAAGATVRVEGARSDHQLLLDTVARALPPAVEGASEKSRPLDRLELVGRATAEGLGTLVDMLGFFGLVVARMGTTAIRPWRLRLTALVHHMQEAGLNAVPIVALMAFLIGVVLAFQGAAQLRQFGAEVFVVDLIAISVLRELGILLTAIIVAGRSASAFTAAVGSMKMREEIDAMRTLGLDPIEVLVLPRVLALLVMLPILGLVADVAGLVGGALMSWAELGISPGMVRTRLLASTDVS